MWLNFTRICLIFQLEYTIYYSKIYTISYHLYKNPFEVTGDNFS